MLGEKVRLEPEAFFEVDDERTLGFHIYHGLGRRSGVQVAMPIAQLATWRDGRITHFRTYAQRTDALRDLGVTEDELEPIAP